MRLAIATFGLREGLLGSLGKVELHKTAFNGHLMSFVGFKKLANEVSQAAQK
jgi:hypothetical protein